INALKKFKEQGKDVDLRIISSRVMHEKFGVVGDDSFNGSANWSSSSITKHTEDRFLFRNEPELADRFVEEFARLWDRGNPPA
ncbi:MAG: phospholipase D-like domain-containing protein, partial [Pseudomonadota bacterium]